uniref:Uncharacterized protein n=1 Tax=Ciona savignyi TaxID=51511 RepID=H2Y4S9_CIOSA
MFFISINTLCICSSWAVARTILILLSKLPDEHILHDCFLLINMASFCTNLWNYLSDQIEQPKLLKCPSAVLTSLNCIGGTPGSGLSMLMFRSTKNKEDQFRHLVICGVQCVVLMAGAEYAYPHYTTTMQLTHAYDEISHTVHNMWTLLFDRFNYNTRSMKTSRVFEQILNRIYI